MASKDKAQKAEGKRNLTNDLTFVGGGAGLALYAVFGLMNASFIGGVLGLNLAGMIFGYPVESSIMARALVALGMLGGVMACGLFFIAAGSVAGWIAGKVLSLLTGRVEHKGAHGSIR